MREAAFVKQNKDKWLRFEKELHNKKSIAPEIISALYLEVTDDLSYAKTFYPGSNTAAYLNELAASAHQKIYTNKKEPGNVFWRFYSKDFPQMFYNFQKQLLLSFLIFAIFIAVGAFSASSDGTFVRAILGDSYVNMTLENIEKNDPMAVYKQMGQLDMFLGITINNIRVALMAYIRNFSRIGHCCCFNAECDHVGFFSILFLSKRNALGIRQDNMDSRHNRNICNNNCRMRRIGSRQRHSVPPNLYAVGFLCPGH